MSKRTRYEGDTQESYRDWYFNLKPSLSDTDVREIKGFFLPNTEDRDAALVNRLINLAAESNPVDASTECVIDVAPDTQDGFIATVPEGSNGRLMMKLLDFTAVNAPLNIEPLKQNDKFWIWEDWDGSPAVPSSTALWNSDIREYTIPTAYYPDQQSIIDTMKDLTADQVQFTFDSSELLTYTGAKPLILPLSPNFNPAYYKQRNLVNVVDSVGTVPSNISGLNAIRPNEFVISSSINGVAVPMSVDNPEFGLDYLAIKLGFTSTTAINKDKFRVFFGYPQPSGFGNTASAADATVFLANGEMTIAIVVYPLCKANAFGLVYGSMQNINIVSPDIDTATPDQNVLAKIGVGQFSTFALYQFQTGSWLPLTRSTGKNKYFRFQLRDDYNRPYVCASGVPSITVGIACRETP